MPTRSLAQPPDMHQVAAPGTAPRIAVYYEAASPPVVIPLHVHGEHGAGDAPTAGGPSVSGAPTIGSPENTLSTPDSAFTDRSVDTTRQLIELLTSRAHALAREQGGRIPVDVFRELIENLVHASFAGVVVTILDNGNTLRISDQGPGIADKEAALRPGFTSADAAAKRYIRGVGSGFSVVQRALAGLEGTLEIEDNLGQGTVITARIPAPPESPLAPVPAPEYNLPERQLKVLLLTVELAPVGPTRIAQELGISTSTAYRDLVSLEQAGFVACRPSGHRSATDAGLAYIGAVM